MFFFFFVGILRRFKYWNLISQDKTHKDDRELRSLKKRLNSYDSAKEATLDPFFSDLFVSWIVKKHVKHVIGGV